jgi:mannose-6-phosphate isomerase-like protein (cupin superfamily)
MTRSLLAGLGVLSFAANVLAAEADGFAHWTVKDIQETEKVLAASGKDPASQGLGSFGNRAFALAHRKSDGKAEIHERKHDIFFVQGGEATLVTGGSIVDDKPGDGGEHLGTSIKDGKETVLRPGDVVTIPAGMPHQLLIKKGQTFTYFVVKVDVAPPPAKP